MKAKNYYYDKLWKRYRVTKTVNGKKTSYGTYATEEEAEAVVRELKKCSWDKKQLLRIKNELGIKCVRRMKL